MLLIVTRHPVQAGQRHAEGLLGKIDLGVAEHRHWKLPQPISEITKRHSP
jgi:hypothetical protein